ncbi:MAG: hypothetical protein SCH39_00990 [Methanosarcinales archaeon]|nr:hypothetical protein [Methanosarcinales archaeon]
MVGELEEQWGKMHFNGHTKPQGWLPPCCPIIRWWQGQLYIAAPPDSQINRKAPASPPHHKGRRSIPRGAPGKVKTKGRKGG